MPQKDTGTDMSEMRDEMDTIQGDTSKRMSEMQDEIMGYNPDEDETEESEVRPEQANYRVVMADFGCDENDSLFIEYYADFQSAVSTFNKITADTEFIKHYDRINVMVKMEKSYRGLSQVFWEMIKQSIVYDDGR